MGCGHRWGPDRTGVCRLLAILLWMHNGLGYIYGKQPGYMDQSARQVKPQGLSPKRKRI